MVNPKVEIRPRRHVRIWWETPTPESYEIGISELVSWLVEKGELLGLMAIEPQELDEQDYRSLDLECDQPLVTYPDAGLQDAKLSDLLRWAVREAIAHRSRDQ